MTTPTVEITLEVVNVDRTQNRVHFKLPPDQPGPSSTPSGLTLTVDQWDALHRPAEVNLTIIGTADSE